MGAMLTAATVAVHDFDEDDDRSEASGFSDEAIDSSENDSGADGSVEASLSDDGGSDGADSDRGGGQVAFGAVPDAAPGNEGMRCFEHDCTHRVPNAISVEQPSMHIKRRSNIRTQAVLRPVRQMRLEGPSNRRTRGRPSPKRLPRPHGVRGMPAALPYSR